MNSVTRRTSFLLGLALLAGLWMAPVPALAAPADPAAFVSGLVDQALGLIRQKELSDADRESKFDTLLNQNFDIPRISRYVLGRYWNAASEDERTKFSQVFEKWVVRTYAARFKEYSGENIKVGAARSENDVNFVVASQLVHADNRPPAKVNWIVRKEGDAFKIVDVEVEGISMAQTQRDEFAAVIQRGGGTVASLNSTLEQRLASGQIPTTGQAK